MQRSCDSKPTGLGDGRKGNHTHRQRHNIADHHTDQDGRQLENAFCKVVAEDDDRQRNQRDRPVLPRAEALAAGAAGHILDGRRVKRKADCKDDRSGYKRREEHAQIFDKYAEYNRDAAAHDLSAEDSRQIELSADGQQRRHVGEADAHDDRQPRADTPVSKHLYQGGDRRDQKGNLNQDGFVGAVKTNRVGYKDRRRHDADNRRDDMLEPERKHLPGRRHARQFEYGASCTFTDFTHSRNFLTKIFLSLYFLLALALMIPQARESYNRI